MKEESSILTPTICRRGVDYDETCLSRVFDYCDTLDELIALMDDNDLWGLWDMLLNAWPESV